MDRSEHIFLWLIGISIAALVIHDLQRRNNLLKPTPKDVINDPVSAPSPQNISGGGDRFRHAIPIGNQTPLVGAFSGARFSNGGFGFGGDDGE